MRTKAEVRDVYERISDSFAPTRARAWPEALRFIEGLPRASRVLDLGCGNGRHMKALLRSGHRAIGVDFSRRLVAIGRAELGTTDASWVEAQAGLLPFHDDCFDAAMCIAVLHHLPTEGDRLEAIEEVVRVLRRGARVVVSVWDRAQPRFQGWPIDEQGDAEIPWTLPDGTRVGRYYHMFRRVELEALIIGSGLHGDRFFRSSGNLFVLATKRS